MLWKILRVPVSSGRATDTRDWRVWGVLGGGLEGSGGIGDTQGGLGVRGPDPCSC